jgi:hypothetical protein
MARASREFIGSTYYAGPARSMRGCGLVVPSSILADGAGRGGLPIVASQVARLLLLGVCTLAVGVSAQSASQDSASQVEAAFRHDRHAAFSCLDCHVMQPDHGALTVQETVDCRGCHHAPERTGLDCAYCHRVSELRDVGGPQSRTLALSVDAEPAQRELDFSHADHEARDCADCHRGGPTLEPESLDCGSCHEEHHDVTNDGCWRCHRAPPESVHSAGVHTSCAGSGCHVDPPIASPPRTRVGCLWCHEPQRDHEPEGVCEDCHTVRIRAIPHRRSRRVLLSARALRPVP